jgi:hypothetical protein
MMREKKYRVSEKLIQKAATEKWMRPLALFQLIKATFGNSVIYGYQKRMQELSGRFGVSCKTLYKYFDILQTKELINFPHNLHLVSVNGKKNCKIKIEDTDNIWMVTCRLYAKLIESHCRRIAFRLAIQKYGERDPRKVVAGESAPLFSLSVRNVAKLLNISEKTAQKVLKTLKDLNVLRIHPPKREKLTDGEIPVKMFEDLPGYRFISGNGMYLQFGQRIEPVEYPVKIPKITPKIYSKFCKPVQCKKSHNY